MLNLKAIRLAVALVLLAPGAAQAADAAKLPPPTIAIIDVQRILEESLAAKSVQKQLGSQRAKFQDEIEKEENDLRKAEDDLGKSRDQMANDVYTEREQQLRQRFLTVERHVEARRKVLDQAFTDSMNDVRNNLLRVVTDVAHERGANLVLVKQQALWVDKPLDVTDEVLERLNKKLPQLTVKMPAEDKP
jgi:Skp family chaperone for outer membrane proteins